MAETKAIGKIFGMFDKVDDIVYEPINLVCDVIRQGLKQVDVHNDKVKAKHDQELAMQMKQFEQNLELDRKRREMELTIDQRRMEEKISQMIADNDLKRREDMVQMEIRYRKEMAEAATQLAQIMASMQVDTRNKILTLYKEKTNEYLEIQKKFEENLYNNVYRMQKLFPGENSDEKIMDYTFKQLEEITQRSSDFVKSMNEDMRKVLVIIDNGMTEITGLAAKYFKAAEPNQPALTQRVVDQIV